LRVGSNLLFDAARISVNLPGVLNSVRVRTQIVPAGKSPAHGFAANAIKQSVAASDTRLPGARIYNRKSTSLIDASAGDIFTHTGYARSAELTAHAVSLSVRNGGTRCLNPLVRAIRRRGIEPRKPNGIKLQLPKLYRRSSTLRTYRRV
jgi:hypothetical protein